MTPDDAELVAQVEAIAAAMAPVQYGLLDWLRDCAMMMEQMSLAFQSAVTAWNPLAGLLSLAGDEMRWCGGNPDADPCGHSSAPAAQVVRREP